MTLKNEDLKGTIVPEVSIDEFNPKSGEEKDVIVIAFFLTDQEPADDLNTFIQRGFIDTLDVEISPSTDEKGNYLVFVEMARDDTFVKKFYALIKDIENVSGKLDWAIKTYHSGDREFKLDDTELLNYIILNPEMYVPRDEFKMKEIEEGIENFFKASMITGLTIDGNIVRITHNGRKIVAEVVDIGDYDTVIGRNFLSESAFMVGQVPFEAKVLQNMLGNCNVLPIGNYLCVSRGEKVMLIKDTQLEYRN
jgi:hypothetical protein